MDKITRFEDLIAWQKARLLCKDIKMATRTKPFADDFRFKSQIESSSGSVMDNIAEGFDRGGNAEFRQQLCIAKASCAETRSQLYRALDYRYISEETFQRLRSQAEEVSRIISGLIGYLSRSENRGFKYRDRESR